jgi:hypothetical protein
MIVEWMCLALLAADWRDPMSLVGDARWQGDSLR